MNCILNNHNFDLSTYLPKPDYIDVEVKFKIVMILLIYKITR